MISDSYLLSFWLASNCLSTWSWRSPTRSLLYCSPRLFEDFIDLGESKPYTEQMFLLVTPPIWLCFSVYVNIYHDKFKKIENIRSSFKKIMLADRKQKDKSLLQYLLLLLAFYILPLYVSGVFLYSLHLQSYLVW